MSSKRSVSLFISTLAALLVPNKSQSREDYIAAWLDVSDKYDSTTNIIPLNQPNTTKLNITIEMHLVSINSFDEVSQKIDVSAYLKLSWKDEFYPSQKSSTLNNSLSSTLSSAIWTPPIYLLNSVSGSTVIAAADFVTFHFLTGAASMEPWIRAVTYCSPDVYYYPFDIQECSFAFSTWIYTSNQINFFSSQEKIGTNLYYKNTEWKVKETSYRSYVYSQNDSPVVEFVLTIERQPFFYLLNIMLPVVLLAVLNVMVFLLPAVSGERIGFSITCFLAYVVMLNTIMNLLPKASNPIALISFYTAVLMVFSAGITLTVIVTLRLHHKPEDESIPSYLKGFVQTVTCTGCRDTRSTARVTPRDQASLELGKRSSTWSLESIGKDVKHGPSEPVREQKVPITWTKVGNVVDNLAFVGFLVGQIVFTVGYMVPLAMNSNFT